MHGTDNLIGNHVEQEMVRFCDLDFSTSRDGSMLYEDDRGSELFKTLRVFEFDQTVQSQSVVVQLGKSTPTKNLSKANVEQHGERTMLFSKGSYESIVARCRPETVPSELADVVQSRSYEGYYIIAVAYKVLSEGDGGR